MRAATVVQVLQDLFYVLLHKTCDRSLTSDGCPDVGLVNVGHNIAVACGQWPRPEVSCRLDTGSRIPMSGGLAEVALLSCHCWHACYISSRF